MFNKIKIISLKELTSYFKSPIAYVSLFVMMIIFNVFFYLLIEGSRETNLKDMFQVMEFMFVFLIPLLTMRIFAEEKQNATMEFLMTTPTTNTEIVLGKYLGILSFYTLVVLLTSVYCIIMNFYGSIDLYAAAVGYFGIWLEGAFFIAVGVMCSSFTKNQILAAVTSYLVLFLLYFSIGIAEYLTGNLKSLVDYIAIVHHSENFFIGLISLDGVVYYLSGIFFSIILTRLTIETRLWH
jgi:ABC-2 type transport system permease protein